MRVDLTLNLIFEVDDPEEAGIDNREEVAIAALLDILEKSRDDGPVKFVGFRRIWI